MLSLISVFAVRSVSNLKLSCRERIMPSLILSLPVGHRHIVGFLMSSLIFLVWGYLD